MPATVRSNLLAVALNLSWSSRAAISFAVSASAIRYSEGTLEGAHRLPLSLHLRPDPPADTQLTEELKPPAGDQDVGAVPAVGEVVVEDGFDRFRGFRTPLPGADVDPLVGVVGEDANARLSKGAITAPM